MHPLAMFLLFQGLLFITCNIKLDTWGHCCHTRDVCAAAALHLLYINQVYHISKEKFPLAAEPQTDFLYLH